MPIFNAHFINYTLKNPVCFFVFFFYIKICNLISLYEPHYNCISRWSLLTCHFYPGYIYPPHDLNIKPPLSNLNQSFTLLIQGSIFLTISILEKLNKRSMFCSSNQLPNSVYLASIDYSNVISKMFI